MRPLKALAAAGAAVALALSSLSPAFSHTDSRNNYFLNLDTVKKIACQQGEYNVFGTGTIVGRNRVLTANHVVYGTDSCTIDGHPAKTIWSDATGDIAMLAVNLGDTPVTQFSCEGYKAYQPYFAVGYAQAEDFAINLIHPTTGREVMPKSEEYPFDVRPETLAFGEFISGMSGGPVMGLDGRIAGIINASDGRTSLTRDLTDTALCAAMVGETPADPPVATIAPPALGSLHSTLPPSIIEQLIGHPPSSAGSPPKASQTGSPKVGG